MTRELSSSVTQHLLRSTVSRRVRAAVQMTVREKALVQMMVREKALVQMPREEVRRQELPGAEADRESEQKDRGCKEREDHQQQDSVRRSTRQVRRPTRFKDFVM